MRQTLLPLRPSFDPGDEGYVVLARTKQVFQASPALLSALLDGGLDRLPEAERAALASDVGRLERLGYLTPPAATGPRAFRGTSAYGLHLFHGCNLACAYCNVGHGAYGGGIERMSPEVADAAIDVIAQRALSTSNPDVVLILFGGEPTLNWEVLERTAFRFRSRFPHPPSDLWVVTNGTTMDDGRAGFLAANDVMTVLSLDGDREHHDRQRPFATGGGSYDAAIRALEALRRAGARFVVRGTWTPGTGDRLQQLHHLRRVAGDALQLTVAIDYFAGPDGYAAYERSVIEEWRRFEQSGYRQEAPATSAVYIDQIVRGEWSPSFVCPAGKGGFSITPNGDIYTCQLTAEKRLHCVGNVLRDGVEPRLLADAASSLHLDDPGEACATCTIGGFCEGPCLLVRPLKTPHRYCQTVETELFLACRFAATASMEALVARYQIGLTSARTLHALRQAAGLRELLRRANRHLLPLALAPAPGSDPSSRGAAC